MKKQTGEQPPSENDWPNPLDDEEDDVGLVADLS